MELPRLPHDPGALVEFFDQGLSSLGAICERSWHDRLEILVEGRAATVWNAAGSLHQVELLFPPANDSAPREAEREVFPGCPLTFRLAELLRPVPLPLDRVVFAPTERAHAPETDVAAKLWHTQFPGSSGFRLAAGFTAAHHFSLIVLMRCEIQAIDQHWSLHRLALSLPGGETDDALAKALDFAEADPAPVVPVAWPRIEFARWQPLLLEAIRRELGARLAPICNRQENYLRRELDRIDNYFAGYERELSARAGRSAGKAGRLNLDERLAAARAEHARRRTDQVLRHEIRVVPHCDGLLLVAEPAWRAEVSVVKDHALHSLPAVFIPRARKWVVAERVLRGPEPEKRVVRSDVDALG